MKGDVAVAGDTGDENLAGFWVDREDHVDIAELVAGVDAADEEVEGVFGEVLGVLRVLRFGGGAGGDFVDESVGVTEVVESEEAEGGECDLDDEGEEDGEGF